MLSSVIHEVKDGEPSDCELEELSLELVGKWEELGRRLGFNQAAITNFDEDNNKLAKKAFKINVNGLETKRRLRSHLHSFVLCLASQIGEM